MAYTGNELVTPPQLDEDKDGYQITRVFRIQSDTPTTIAAAKAAAISGALVPAPYAEHPEIDDALLVSYNVEEESRYSYLITCNYSSNSNDAGEGKDGSGNPTNDPMSVRNEISWDSKEVEIFLTQDLDGNKITNKAGDLFDPPISRKVYRRILNVTFNSISFNSGVIDTYVGACNNGVWNGYAAKRVLCTGIKTTPAEKDGVFYNRVTMSFEILHSSEPDWRPTKILNAGMRKKVGANFELIEIGTPPNNYPVNSPVPLLADGSGPIDPANPPNFCEFNLVPQVDFSAIPRAIVL